MHAWTVCDFDRYYYRMIILNVCPSVYLFLYPCVVYLAGCHWFFKSNETFLARDKTEHFFPDHPLFTNLYNYGHRRLSQFYFCFLDLNYPTHITNKKSSLLCKILCLALNKKNKIYFQLRWAKRKLNVAKILRTICWC